jgi:hypothetical protein
MIAVDDTAYCHTAYCQLFKTHSLLKLSTGFAIAALIA